MDLEINLSCDFATLSIKIAPKFATIPVNTMHDFCSLPPTSKALYRSTASLLLIDPLRRFWDGRSFVYTRPSTLFEQKFDMKL